MYRISPHSVTGFTVLVLQWTCLYLLILSNIAQHVLISTFGLMAILSQWPYYHMAILSHGQMSPWPFGVGHYENVYCQNGPYITVPAIEMASKWLFLQNPGTFSL